VDVKMLIADYNGMVWYSRVYRPTRHIIGHFGDENNVWLHFYSVVTNMFSASLRNLVML